MKEKEIEWLIDRHFVIEKFTGKGAWSFVAIPDIQPQKENPFGWVTVKGSIDDFQLSQYKLMPMGNGSLFLPIKKEIRKKINKEEGDTVHVKLSLDHSAWEIPYDFLLCLNDEPAAKTVFYSWTEKHQKQMVKYIFSVKDIRTQADRMAQAIQYLTKNKKPGWPD